MLKIVDFGLLAGVLVVVVALIATNRKGTIGSSETQPPPSEDMAGQEPKTAS